MAETLTAPAPAPAAPQPKVAPKAAPSQPAPAKEPSAPASPQKQSIFQSIHDAKPRSLPDQAKPKADPALQAQPEPKTPEKVITVNDELAAEPAKPDAASETNGDPSAAAQEKKSGPWKQARVWQKKAEDAERQLAEVRTLSTKTSSEQQQALQSRLDESEKQKEELLNEIRYVNYQKHPEFKRDYVEPYDRAVAKALNDLKEITVTDQASGESRQATGQDLMTLVNLPLGQARELADQWFGKFSNDIMGHRKEIRSLFEKQQGALEEARTKGSERETKQQAQWKQQQEEIRNFVTQARDDEMKRMIEHQTWGEFFKPKEGDDEGNALLEKGYDLVREAMSKSPDDPSLTKEERLGIIRKRVAVWNKAGSYNRLIRDLRKARADLAEKDKTLSEFQSSKPTIEGQRQAAAVSEGNHWDSFGQRLAKKAKGG